MIATAADYAWFDDEFSTLAESYCLTLARGLTAIQFLGRLEATSAPSLTGIEALPEASMDLWRESNGKRLLIAVTTVPGEGGGWAMGVEFNGFLGVTEELIVPLSAGTRVVSHFWENIELASRFYWVEDRDIRLSFELLSSCYREGSTADALVDVMQAVGFDSCGEGEDEHPVEAAFALAEYLTGVRLTPELLEASTYTCGIVVVP